MSKIKFSVLGFGRIGQRHAKIINEYEDSELISVVDTDPAQLEATQSLDLNPEKYTSIEDFLAHDKLQSEVVNIATPNGFHTDYAIKLLEAGYHVVIEK